MAPFHFSITVYNSAGERVRRISDFVPAWQTPTGVKAQQSVFCPDDGVLFLATVEGCAYALSWDGFNDSGQLAQGGTYQLMIESRDAFGAVSSFSAPATVLRAPSQLSIEIFNSAGEKVRSLVPPAGATLESLSTSRKSFDKSSALVIQYGSSPAQSLVWDGLSDSGSLVSSGIYTVQAIQQRKGQSPESRMQAVQFLALPMDSATVIAWPNPAGPAEAEIHFSVTAAAGSRLSGSVYNLAGEHVAELGPVFVPQSLTWNLRKNALSSGVYLARLQIEGASGQSLHRTLKVSILR